MNVQTIEKLEAEIKHLTVAVDAMKLGILRQDRDLEQASQEVLKQMLNDALRMVIKGQ